MGRRKKEEQGRREKKRTNGRSAKFLKENTLRERESKINDWSRRKLGPGPRNKEPDKIQVH